MYLETDQGFLFRFPFPDEDSTAICGDVEYNRTVPVVIENFNRLGYENEIQESENSSIGISHQKLVVGNDGSVFLALVFRDLATNELYRMDETMDTKYVVNQIVKNHILNENSPDTKKLYQQIAYRILQGLNLRRMTKTMDQRLMAKTDLHHKPSIKEKSRKYKSKGL